MTQGFLVKWISGHLQKQEQDKVRAVLARMGLQDVPSEWDPLRWELLEWFVSYATLKVDGWTDEQWSNLDEEIQVIQILSTFNMTPWIPTPDEMKRLQNQVLRILEDLTETQTTRIGPIPVEFVIWRGRKKQREMPEAQQPQGVVMIGGLPSLIGQPPAEGIAFQVPPGGMEALLYVLAQLLTKYPGAVRRCRDRNCRKLFARFKTKSDPAMASSCSRTCQARSYEKAKYATKKALEEQKQKEEEVRKCGRPQKAGKTKAQREPLKQKVAPSGTRSAKHKQKGVAGHGKKAR